MQEEPGKLSPLYTVTVPPPIQVILSIFCTLIHLISYYPHKVGTDNMLSDTQDY